MKYICLLITLVFWPISLFLNNQNDWYWYIIPALILLLVCFLNSRYRSLFPFPFLILPVIHPAYLAFSIIGLSTLFIYQTKLVVKVLYLLFSIVILVFYFKPFINNSIFIFDPLKNDQLIKKISTVPSQVLSKIYENKTTIPTQKYISNLFLTIDLNNYFFAFHPREIVQENQNLHKYPFAAIIPFLIGLYIIFDKNNQKIKKITLTLFTLSALSLGFINNIDKFDFILYIPVTTITLLGLKKIFSMKNNSVILLTFILFIFSAIDLVKLFIN